MLQTRRSGKFAGSKWWKWVGVHCFVVLAGIMCGFGGARARAEGVGSAATLTNTLEVRGVLGSEAASNCFIRLEGVVLWVSAGRDRLILQDEFGGLAVSMDLRRQPTVQPKQRVMVEGLAKGVFGGIASGGLIDNDGRHGSTEKSMAVHLEAGMHPISVEWFNASGRFDLAVDWKVPGMERERIPNEALFQPTGELGGGGNAGGFVAPLEGGAIARSASSSTARVDRGPQRAPGLAYQCYEGAWQKLPSFGELQPVKQGVTENFDLRPRTRDTNVALAFQGILEAPRSGEYMFWARSDDGSKLWLEEQVLHVRVLGEASLPTAVSILPGGPVTEELENRWVRMEGTVAEVEETPEGVMVDLTSGSGPAYLKVPGGDRDSLRKLLHRRVEASGICQKIYSLAGQTVPSLLVSEPEGIVLGETDVAEHVIPTTTNTSQLGATNATEAQGLPLLTKVIQVMHLSRTEAKRGYPVRVRGVVTATMGMACFVQDATWSIFVYWNGGSDTPKVGDFWEIEGSTSAHFAPDIQMRSGRYLGPGAMPEPIHPTWDELVNGSLTTKYVEIQGIATAVTTNELTLLTRDGKVELKTVNSLEPELVQRMAGALVRVRGVGSQQRDNNEMILMMASLRLFNATVTVEESAPAEPFAIPTRHAANLLFFDPRANALRRVKIAGQILQERHGEYFAMDGTNGFRFVARDKIKLQPGDLAEVVGFPDMSGPSPVLLEALARKTGKAGLPEAVRLSEEDMWNGKHDATLVSITSRLISLGTEHADQILELQSGNRTYTARLTDGRRALSHLLPGSLVDLTGVYAGRGGDRAASRGIDSFELLLNSPMGVQVLARPPWWNLRHTLTVLGVMALVILAAVVWITLLRRQVEERSLQLAAEIKSREQAERHRALEVERARIAQDLHDDLGATLTEIRFLSAVESRDAQVPETTRSQLMEVSEKSRQMVTSLDEIVWAVNPANDSLPSLTSYLRHVAEEFFRTTEVRCRLDVDPSPPPVALTSEVRHNLYLAVREALNNVAKHSQAAEAWLRIHWEDGVLTIVVEDDGCGFEEAEVAGRGNGLRNMRRRLEKIGGEFECETKDGRGTRCKMRLPLTEVRANGHSLMTNVEGLSMTNVQCPNPKE